MRLALLALSVCCVFAAARAQNCTYTEAGTVWDFTSLRKSGSACVWRLCLEELIRYKFCRNWIATDKDYSYYACVCTFQSRF